MIVKITALAVLSVLFTLGGSVYAETATVEVPFDSHGQSCNFDEIAVEYHCTWQGLQEKFDYETLQEYKDLLSDGMYDAEIAKLNEQALAEIAIEKAKLTPNERTILEIEEKLLNGEATASESVLMNLLKKLNTCKQGMDKQTAPFQSAREFEISSFNLWMVNNVAYEGHVIIINILMQIKHSLDVKYCMMEKQQNKSKQRMKYDLELMERLDIKVKY